MSNPLTENGNGPCTWEEKNTRPVSDKYGLKSVSIGNLVFRV